MSSHIRFAAAKAETDKLRAFELFVDVAGYVFLPLAGESFRRLGKEAARFLSDLSKVAASDVLASKSAFLKKVRQELSSTLCHYNALIC